jgi:hypothetical protein
MQIFTFQASMAVKLLPKFGITAAILIGQDGLRSDLWLVHWTVPMLPMTLYNYSPVNNKAYRQQITNDYRTGHDHRRKR